MTAPATSTSSGSSRTPALAAPAPMLATPLPGHKRGRRWLLVVAGVLAAFALLVAATLLLPPSTNQATDSITNSGPSGTKALAQVLRANGVAVTQETTLDAAVAAARPDRTLAVVLSAELSEDAVAKLRAVPSDLVLIVVGSNWTQPPGDTVEALTDGQAYAVSTAQNIKPTADCDDPDAVAAGQMAAGQGSIFLPDTAPDPADAVFCFPIYSDYSDFLYADMRLPAHRVTVFAGDQVVRNDTVTLAGNAALALRALGRHPALTWYLPSQEAQADGGMPSLDPLEGVWTLMPPWSRPVLALGLVAAAAAAWWRGRRFGALVPEKLPVAVPASEVTAGLGRLYRQARAAGHSGAALRAATIGRLAARLGLPASASPDVVVQRIAEASGGTPGAINALLYGSPPARDDDLQSLAVALRQLETTLGVAPASPRNLQHSAHSSTLRSPRES